ncbi:neprilysin-1-like [Babylonia areolata]|uniref:neprilysin-1-like n=1 Tax=Babylonia areolata TaxID=304850 RepID=UPI003FD38768
MPDIRDAVKTGAYGGCFIHAEGVPVTGGAREEGETPGVCPELEQFELLVMSSSVQGAQPASQPATGAMSAGVHRSTSPSPVPSPTASPSPFPSQRPLCSKVGSGPLRNGSSSSRSGRSHSSASNIPHLPPPPRPLSSPSLSTLVTVQPSLSSPQLSTVKEEQQQILRKYSDHHHNRLSVSSPGAPGPGSGTVTGTGTGTGPGSALRVDNKASSKKNSAGGVVTTLVEKDQQLFLAMDHQGADNLDSNPHDAARVQFLHKEPRGGGGGAGGGGKGGGGSGARRERLLLPLSLRERYLACVICVLFVACVAFIVVAFTRDAHYKAQSRRLCLSSTCVSTAAELMAGMDVAADPCEDFFQYACGQWNKRHVIPEDEHSFGTFQKLHEKLQVVLRQLLEERPGPSDSNATLKAKTLYKSCVNTTQINFVGDVQMRTITDDLGGWPIILQNWSSDSFVLETMLAKVRYEYNNDILIGCWIAPDDKNSSSNIIKLDQPVLGMPDREYYLKAKSESEFVQAYLKFMRDIVTLMGAPPERLEQQLLDLLEFETMLANVTRPRAERHDTGALYNKMTISTLQQLVPQINWLQYLRRAISSSLTSEEQVVVFAVDYLYDMMNIVQNTDKRTVANYIIWRVVMMLAPELTDRYQAVHNQYKMVLHGMKRGKIRWKKCVENVKELMGLAVGAMFIRDNFRRQSKETALEMIGDIRDAFNELLTENEWMDERTKAVAREKANAMNARNGCPTSSPSPPCWTKDEGRGTLSRGDGGWLQIEEEQYFHNVLRIKRFDAEKKMSVLGKPVDKDVWDQAPAEINAFYNPNSNDIMIPAGILQPLFYSRHFPKSLNYGGIGVVIGHEITHGFDDKGRLYDIEGNLVQWWDNVTIEAFRQRAQCMVDQYSGFKLEQIGHFIDGKHTQGENIADNGGLKQAYRAYRKWVETHGEEQLLPGIGLNHDQLFFLNYAQIWCGNVRDEEALHTIRTSVHSPGPIRVLGPLSNSEDFARAFSCPLGSRMNPRHKCSVW